MHTVSIEEASAHLPELIEEACRGEEVLIGHAGANVVRLTPIPPATPPRGDHSELIGFLKGKMVLREGWDESPEDLRPYME